MIDQIIIGDKASFDDFEASLAKRTRKPPKKKEIKETVPFSNITHDFTAINGEIYWEEAEHEYVFEMCAPTPELLEEMKTAFSGWVMNVIKEELHDPIIPDYHYIVTYDDMSFADEERIDKTTATVKFSAYPYKIANCPKVEEFNIPAFETVERVFLNNSSHRITPKITTNKPINILLNGKEYSMNAGTAEDEAIKLEVGHNRISIWTISSMFGDCNVSISFNEEVF